MQSIERYGVVALLFLVVTVIAVLVWEGDPAMLPGSDVALAKESSAAEVAPAPNRIKMSTRPIRQPLSREALAPNDSLAGTTESTVPSATLASNATRGGGAGIVAAREDAVPGGDDGLLEQPERASRNGKGRRGGREKETKGATEPAETSPAPSVASPTETRAARTYAIAPGDTLSEIAMRELGTMKRWKEIVALNPELDPASLSVGQKILLPDGPGPDAGTVAAAQPAPKSSPKTNTKASREAEPAASGASYTVQKGDSLWVIAERALGDGERWKEIARLNPDIDADRLLVGQRLVVPSSARFRAAPDEVADAAAPRQTSAPRRGKVR